MKGRRVTDETSMSENPSFEHSLSELEQITSELESGELSLDESLQKFECAMGLLKGCYSLLQEAVANGEILTRLDDESIETDPIETRATIDQASRTSAASPNAEKESGDAALF